MTVLYRKNYVTPKSTLKFYDNLVSAVALINIVKGLLKCFYKNHYFLIQSVAALKI